MPLFSDLSSLSMYYGGSLGTSYSSSYLGNGGNYSTHSSLSSYSRPPLTSYSGLRSAYTSSRPYTPYLSTISESSSRRPVGASGILSRLSPDVQSRLSPKYKPQRPVTINTADIDVSRNKYTRAEPRAGVNSDVNDDVDGQKDGGLERGRSTIRRSRPVVRLRTIKRKDKDSPKMERGSLKREDENSSSPTIVDDARAISPMLSMLTKHSPKSKWRETLQDDLEYKDRRANRKTPGEKLKEKFLIRDTKEEEEALTLKELREKKRLENLSSYNEQSTATPTAIKRHASSKRHSVRKPNNLEVDENNDATPSPIQRKASKRMSLKGGNAADNEKNNFRRFSQEMLEEQSQIFDALIRGENLSTTQLDLSKIGLSEPDSTGEMGKMGSKRKKKLTDNQTNSFGMPQTRTKSDHAIDEMASGIERAKSPSPIGSKNPPKIRKSSSGGMIATLDSITENPKEPIVHQKLNAISEGAAEVKVVEHSAKVPKLKPKISSTVEVSNVETSLKVKVDDVVIEEVSKIKPKILSNIQYEVVCEETVKPAASEEKTEKNTKSEKPQLDKRRIEMNKSKNPAVQNAVSQILPEKKNGCQSVIAGKQKNESDDENDDFWGKIGKRETIYYKDRRKRLAEEAEKMKKSIFWNPDEELEVIPESVIAEEPSEEKATSVKEIDKSELEQNKTSENVPKTKVNETKDISKNPLVKSSSKVSFDLPPPEESKKATVENTNKTPTDVKKNVTEQTKLDETKTKMKPSETAKAVNENKINDNAMKTTNKVDSVINDKDEKLSKVPKTVPKTEVKNEIKNSKNSVEKEIETVNKKENVEQKTETIPKVEKVNTVIEKKKENVGANVSKPEKIDVTVEQKKEIKTEVAKEDSNIENKKETIKLGQNIVKKEVTEPKMEVKKDIEVKPKEQIKDSKPKTEIKEKPKDINKPKETSEPKVVTSPMLKSPDKDVKTEKTKPVDNPKPKVATPPIMKSPEKEIETKKAEPADNPKPKTATLPVMKSPEKEIKIEKTEPVIEIVESKTEEKQPLEVTKVEETKPIKVEEIKVIPPIAIQPSEETEPPKPGIPEIDSTKDIIKLPKTPSPKKRVVKNEPAARPLIATPRPLQKRAAQRRANHAAVESSSSEEETSSEEEEEETESSESSEDNDEYYECEVTKNKSDKDVRTSTSSNDSGFDSSAPTSPAGIICIKKGKGCSIAAWLFRTGCIY